MPKPYNKLILEEGGYTVELSNEGAKPKKNPNPVNFNKEKVKCRIEGCNRYIINEKALCTKHEGLLHTVDWIGRVIPPGRDREQCKTYAPAHYLITEILVKWMIGDHERTKIMDDFIGDVLDNTAGKIPDSTTLQDSYEGRAVVSPTADGIIILVNSIVDRRFPKESYDKVLLDGEYKKDGEIIHLEKIPIRIVATLLAIAFMCEEANRGDYWYCTQNGVKEKSKMASAYMSAVYYLLRRYTRAQESQAIKSLAH